MRRALRAAGIVLTLSCAGSAFAGELPDEFLNLLDLVPDLTQTAGGKKFADDGAEYCAPVAVSNSLVYLASGDFPNLIPAGWKQVDLAARLAASDYMGTGGGGTSEKALIHGLNRHIVESGYSIDCLDYAGIQIALQSKPPADSRPVTAEWLKSMLLEEFSVWLRIGWYAEEDGRYRKTGGHWVTLVGYRNGNAERAETLAVHDPSPRAGLDPSHDFAVYDTLTQGSIEGFGVPQPAAGWLALTSGIALPDDATIAIVEGAVRLKLAPPQ